jgi:hypothetical protein
MSHSRKSDPLPITSLITVTQTALSCGLGLIVANKLPRTARKIVAGAMLSVGAISALPLIAEVIARQWKGPETARGMRKKLESIREDSGIADELDEVF